MTADELLKPRVKVIAPMPLMKNDVGTYLRRIEDNGDFSFGIATTNDGVHFFDLEQFKKWPHIFRIVNWWEDVLLEQLPKYLKMGHNGKVRKVQRYFLFYDPAEVLFEGGKRRKIKTDWIICTEQDFIEDQSKK